jgi:Domain of unknown function (DUF4276)
MPRLLVHVEGETEEDFVNEILATHLRARGYEDVSARKIGSARQRHHRGGARPWNSVRRDILRHLQEDQGCIATTMVDYYGLPKDGERAWPGRREAEVAAVPERAAAVEQALLADIASEMGGDFHARRFIPFVTMHEFEGLLFSDCAAFARGVARPELQPRLQEIRDQFATPEDINDSPVTAPSKRGVALMPDYDKRLFGCLAVLEIGLHKINEECPHFRDWLSRLEAQAAMP